MPVTLLRKWSNIQLEFIRRSLNLFSHLALTLPSMISRLVKDVTYRWVISVWFTSIFIRRSSTVLYIDTYDFFIYLVKSAATTWYEEPLEVRGWRRLTLFSIIVSCLLFDLSFMTYFILIGHDNLLLVLTHHDQILLRSFTFLLGLWLLFVHRGEIVIGWGMLFLLVIISRAVGKRSQLFLDSGKRTWL